MAALSHSRIAWTYTADDGTQYRVSAEKAITDQAKQGGADGSAVALSKPASLKMRRVSVSDGAGHSRVVPCYEAGAPIATAGATINLNLALDSATFTSNGNPLPEGHIRKSVTRQTT
jgi:hypothetical protein